MAEKVNAAFYWKNLFKLRHSNDQSWTMFHISWSWWHDFQCKYPLWILKRKCSKVLLLWNRAFQKYQLVNHNSFQWKLSHTFFGLTLHVKMFLKPVWECKMHGGTKIGIFRPLFCVRMLGKSTNYSTGTWPLCSTFWAK